MTITDKQKFTMNTLLDQLDMKNKNHRKNLVRRFANNKYRSINEIPVDLASHIIIEIQNLLAEPRGMK
jgi:hypothetical protein